MIPYILAAVLSNVAYALADNTNGLAVKQNQPLRVALWVTTYGIVIFLIPLLLFFEDELQRLTLSTGLVMVGLNVLINVGYLCFVTGMRRGSVTLTGVLGGSFPAVTTLTALVFLGERVTPEQFFMIILVLAGIVLSSIRGQVANLVSDLRTSGVIFGLGACVCWGVYFALVRFPVEQVGWFLPQYSALVVGFVMFHGLAWRSGDRTVGAWPKLWWLVAMTGTLQVTGSMLYNYAISQGTTAIVAPIAGSSPALFVVMAYFIFKERLNKKQWIGIVLALTGIIGLATLSSS